MFTGDSVVIGEVAPIEPVSPTQGSQVIGTSLISSHFLSFLFFSFPISPFHFTLSYFIPSHFLVSHSLLSYSHPLFSPIISYSLVLSYPLLLSPLILSSLILSCPLVSNLILSYLFLPSYSHPYIRSGWVCCEWISRYKHIFLYCSFPYLQITFLNDVIDWYPDLLHSSTPLLSFCTYACYISHPISILNVQIFIISFNFP